MPSIVDIDPDPFYQQPSDWTLLLYELEGTSLVIPLANAQLMSFLQVFEKIKKCRERILERNERMITLFAYSGNIEKWWATYQDDTPFNLQEIHVFCNEEKDVLWMNTYTGRFKSIIKQKFVYDRLNEKLLYYAIGLIDRVISEFQQHESDLKNIRKQLSRALSDHFGDLSRS